MVPVEIDQLGARLDAERRRARDRLLLALLATAATPPAALLSWSLLPALAAGAVAELLLGLVAWVRFRDWIRELALVRAAYAIPTVRRFGEALVRPSRRLRLARSLESLRPDGPDLGAVVLHERVRARAPQLAVLSARLRATELALDPTSAASCLRLLTDGRRSPLLNPRLSLDDLDVELHHILAGFGEPPDA